MLDQRSLDFSGGETMAGYVDNVVYAATDPVVALMVSSRSVTSELGLLVSVQLKSKGSFVRSIPCTRSGRYPCIVCERPRLFVPY